jgi:hypothetical protein
MATEQSTSGPGTVVVLFKLRSPDNASAFEQLMASHRASVVDSLDSVSSWSLERPIDVPGQDPDVADYVLLAELAEVDRWEEEDGQLIESLFGKLLELVFSPQLLVVRPVS